MRARKARSLFCVVWLCFSSISSLVEAPGAPDVGTNNGGLDEAPPVLELFGHTVNSILASNMASTPRDLDVVEVFSGVASIVTAARSEGMHAEPFDKNRVLGRTNVPGQFAEDVTTEAGFLNCVRLVLRVRVGGLVTLAPECSSFVNINKAGHKRGPGNQYTKATSASGTS